MIRCNGSSSVAQGSRAGGAQTARLCAGRVGGRYPFVGSTKRVLHRVLSEKGVVLTAEAQARLNALPERFMAFLAEIDSPASDNARTARFHPLDGPGRQPGQEPLSTGVGYARAPKAA